MEGKMRKPLALVGAALILAAIAALAVMVNSPWSGNSKIALEKARIQAGAPAAGNVNNSLAEPVQKWHVEANGVMWRYADSFAVSPPARDLPLAVPGQSEGWQDNEEYDVPYYGVDRPDTVVQRAMRPQGALAPAVMPTPIITFAGISLAEAGAGTPPDPTGDVGPNHYVQAINSAFAIYNKTGTRLAGPTNINQLWQNAPPGPCRDQNRGDPIILYDQLADRWLISQFTYRPAPYYECIAISQTPDPTGQYYLYSFLTNQTDFEDYPHMGVWPDGYYAAFHEFGAQGYNGARPFAFERARMLAGNPQARMQTNAAADNDSTGYMPADLDGMTQPAAGAPNPFVSVTGNGVKLFRYAVNWENPGASQWAGPFDVPTAPFTRLCQGNDDCIPQNGTQQKLDGLSPRPMFRAAYRNFGTHESLVFKFNVDAGQGQAAFRWMEIRNLGGTPSTHQQGTYAPDATNRWMGSVAMDRLGNLAMGYSASSADIFPSLRYAGRLSGDPLGQLAQGEATLFAGTSFQADANRWGDYSQLSVDPTDDCTFWYTAEYVANSPDGWTTRIGSFKFEQCTANAPTPTPPPPTNTPQATPTTDPQATPTDTPAPEPTEVIDENGEERAMLDNGVITSTLTVDQGPIIDAIDVIELVITHTNPADLDVVLISPQGTEVLLFADICESEAWSIANTGFNLSDEAMEGIGDTCPPGVWTYRPEEGLEAFNGEPSSGVWRLEITDDSQGGTGVIGNWGLSIASEHCPIEFSDVPENHTFYPFIRCLACGSILGGYADGTFRPGNDVTRGQLSKIVANAAGFEEPVSGQTFTDVPPGSTFYEYVERLASRGIIGGYPDGTFRPQNTATRGQISKIVSIAAGFNEPVSGQTFTDVPPGSTFYEYVERLASRGIIGGYPDGTFRPQNTATRGQTAKVVTNSFYPGCTVP